MKTIIRSLCFYRVAVIPQITLALVLSFFINNVSAQFGCSVSNTLTRFTTTSGSSGNISWTSTIFTSKSNGCSGMDPNLWSNGTNGGTVTITFSSPVNYPIVRLWGVNYSTSFAGVTDSASIKVNGAAYSLNTATASIGANTVCNGTGTTGGMVFTAAGNITGTTTTNYAWQDVTLNAVNVNSIVITTLNATDPTNAGFGVIGATTCSQVFYTISGTVYNDANGLTDNTVNGTGSNTGATMYAILYDNTTGKITAITTVASNGTYSLGATPGDNYKIEITTTSSTLGNTSLPAVTLPSGWVNTGSQLNGGMASNTTPGILMIGTSSSNISSANFGIDNQPTGNSLNATSQPNPGGTTQAVVSSNVFNGTDTEDGTYTTGLAGRTVTLNAATSGGNLYYNGTLVSTATTITNFDPAKVTVDPAATGVTNVIFTYTENDNAGVASAAITATVPFSAPTITMSGAVWDDANGDAVKNASESFTNVGGLLYANLVNSSNVIVSSVLVDAATGAYSFGGAASTAYKIILTNGAQTVGSTLTISSLPSGWSNTGINITGVANTANQTGIISLTTPASGSATNRNFGIEQLPTASNASGTYVNPGGTNTVTVPTLTGTDPEEGIYNGTSNTNTIKIQTLPSSGTLYYNGVVISTVQTISNYNPALLTYDPANGAGAFTFTYSEVDAAGVASTVATVTLNFTDLTVSGTVYDDANGGTIGGTATNTIGSNMMYANLISGTTGKVIASVAVAANGTYSFGTASGIAQNTTYTVTVTNSQGTVGNNPPSTTLTNAINTAEGTTSAGDGTADGSTVVSITTSNVTANFGLDQKPSGTDYTAPTQPNPGGGTGVAIPVAAFNGTDPEDGTYANNLAGRSIVINPPNNPNDALYYYNGVLLTTSTTISNFDPTVFTFNPNAEGAVTRSFTYNVIDNAGTVSPNITVTIPFSASPLSLSGNVWNDINGNAVQNGTSAEPYTNAGGIYANLVNASTGAVVSSVLVDATSGAYALGGTKNRAYNIILTSSSQVIGATLTTSSLPTGWVNTGVNLNGTANTGNQAGIIAIAATTNAVTGQNFGIEQPPTAGSGTQTSSNPGGTIQVTVNAGTFTNTTASSDPSPGAVTGIVITGFPSGATTIVINGTSYTSATFPAAGVTVPSDASGNPTQIITVDPSGTGATSVAISFKAVDAAGQKSSNTGTATINFNTVLVSGNVYDDVNGLNDNTVNTSIGGTNAGGTLNAVLYDNTTSKIAAVAVVGTNGTYSFGATPGDSYMVEITTNTAVAGATTLPAVAVPSDWALTGENLGSGTGSDGTVDGKLSLGTVSTSISNANFGIDQRPSGIDVTYVISPVPTRGSTHALTGAYRNMLPLTYYDPEDCASTCPNNFGVIIKSFGNMNGNVLSYNGVPITPPYIIANYKPDSLTVTFNQSGFSSFNFYYVLIDAAGVQSIDPNYNVSWGSSVLAVNLVNFTAEQQGDVALLKWSTAAGSINDKFTIERNADSRNWTALKTLAGTGSSGTRQDYSYIDSNPLSGDNYYRIKQVDKNGNNVYSETRLLKFGEKWIVSLSPNPVAGGEVKLVSNQPVSMIRITDLQGRTVLIKSMSVTTAQGSVNEELNTGRLASGTYLVQVVSGSGKTQTLKLVKW